MKVKYKSITKIIVELLIAFIFVLFFSTKVNAETDDYIAWPVPDFYDRTQGWHDGCAIDIGGEGVYGRDVVSAVEGTIIRVFRCTANHFDDGQYYYDANGNLVCTHDCNGFGIGVVIRGKDNRTYQYAHMSRLEDWILKANDENQEPHVYRGEKIGEVGNTGMSTGAHLHFGITNNWNYWEPSGINPNNEIYKTIRCFPLRLKIDLNQTGKSKLSWNAIPDATSYSIGIFRKR